MSNTEGGYKKAADAGIIDPNFQAVHALEFIALALGRIDEKLEILVTSVRGGNVVVGKGLSEVVGAIRDAGAKIKSGGP